ncbi:MAG: hypothetical protein ACTTI5_03170 [Treponema sp.]
MKQLLFKIGNAIILSSLLCILFVSCKNESGSEDPKPVLSWKSGLPDVSKRQTIDANEIYAWYEGKLNISVDGKSYGPYSEKVCADNNLLPGKIVFESKKTQYDEKMHNVTIRFRFDNIDITAKDGGKMLVFTGKDGKAFLSMMGGTEQAMGDNTSVAGAFYKQNDKIYITYTVTYNTSDMKKVIPQIPHNALSGTMIKAEKQ